MHKWVKIFFEAIRGSEKNFTSGSINRAIALLSIPMILEMIMESLFAVVDVFFVSRLGTDAIAAVGLTESVITLVYSMAFGLAMAATAMVARRIGEKRPEEAAKVAGQAIIIALFISILFGVSGFIFAENILRLMGGSEDLIQANKGYTQIIFASNVVIVMLFLLNGVFRGAGDAALAMRTLWLANGLNIILDPLFIFGIGPFPELGVAGAAVATTIGRGVGVLFQLYILFGKKSIVQLSRKAFVWQRKQIIKILDIASTGAFQFVIGSASWIALMYIIARFGSETVAGYTIAIRLIVFTILPAWGMAMAAATLVGQNLGAGKPDRAEASAWKTANYNMFFLFGVSVLFFLNADFLLSLFTQEEAVHLAGVLSLKIICVGYVFFAYGMVITQAFNGAGDTRTPTVINFFCFWLLQIPLAYFLAVQLDWGPAGVYWAITISETVLAIVCIYLFRKGKWKLVEV